MRLVKKQVKKGEKTFTNFYIEVENGKMIAVKPSFTSDYRLLSLVAEEYTPF